MNSIAITLFGGTGLIGEYLKDLIIDDPFFNKINFVTRRVYKSNQKKLVNHVIDFSKYKEISNAIKNSKVVYSAIGTTQSKVNWNKDEYRKVDYDININIAKACKKFQIRNFSFVSTASFKRCSRKKILGFYIHLFHQIRLL